MGDNQGDRNCALFATIPALCSQYVNCEPGWTDRSSGAAKECAGMMIDGETCMGDNQTVRYCALFANKNKISAHTMGMVTLTHRGRNLSSS